MHGVSSSAATTVAVVAMAETTDREALLSLLEPFKGKQVGKLPRVTCGDCSDKRKRCEKHLRERCKTCNAYVSVKHVHLDYVGHAEVTRRLLEVDPAWQWEPLAVEESGLPLIDHDDRGNPVGLWIRLTVLGVTRLGYGSVPPGQGDAVKVLIGDALRNAALRFGVALDMWAKNDRSDPATENAVASGGTASRDRRVAPAVQQTDMAWFADAEARIGRAMNLDDLSLLADEVREKKMAGQCEAGHEAHLWAIGKQREDLLASIPRNKDGSISRSRATDEQLAALGVMTKDEKAEHARMERETKANPKKADRATEQDPADPWVKPVPPDYVCQTCQATGEHFEDECPQESMPRTGGDA